MELGGRFSSENFLMSVCGHLILAAIMVTSFAVVINRAQLVAPDRIEILEIDLNNVRVSGDETILHNVNADAEPDADMAQQQDEPAPIAPPQQDASDMTEPVEAEPEQIIAPSLVVEQPAAPDVPEPVVKTVENTDSDADAEQPKKKKMVVRVNREVVSLDRTLTVSVVDALRVAMTRCWTIDTSRPDIDGIRAVAHLTMRRNGTVRDVWFESAARAETDAAFAYVLDTIRSAINVCQPFKMLPAGEFDKWEKIQLTFYPTQGKVM